MSSTVGFVGLGTMGVPMAVRLLDHEGELLVWSRNPEHMRTLQMRGATATADLLEMTERCQMVVSCLLDTTVVEDVYLGKNGLLKNAREGQVFVEHGTFNPSSARRLAAVASSRAAAFLDAPVTGGPEGAEAGELVVMAGGDRDALDRARAIVESYAQRVLYVGDSGRGLELKLVNQLLVGCHVVAAAEAATLIRRLELPLDVSEELLMSGWGASAMLGRSLRRAVRREDDPTGADIGGMAHVQHLVAAFVAEADVHLSLHPLVTSLFSQAVSAGLADRDLAGIARIFDHHEEEQHEVG